MGLRDEVTADIKEAFNTDFADVIQTFTGKRVIQGEPSIEDILTNTVGSNSTIKTYNGRGFFKIYTDEVDNETILQGDISLLCLQDETSIIPTVDDIIIPHGFPINGADNQECQVVSVAYNSSLVNYTIQLRKV